MAEGAEQEDKTEEPTLRRIEQAIERGDVAHSMEINTFLILGAFTLALMLAATPVARRLLSDLRGYLANAHAVSLEQQAFAGLGGRMLGAFLQAMALPAGMAAAAALAAGLLQHRLVFTPSHLAPKWERVSPMAGLKRIFGVEAWVQFGKGLAKLAVIGVVVGTVLWGERRHLASLAQVEPGAALAAVLGLAIKLMAGALAAHLVIALGDALYQRHRWRARLRMSKEEIKQEHKESEGSPEVKGRMRQIRAQRLKKRMMAAVPTATVVVTNPTHYAVALRYETGMAAPVCVAKGVDSLALRIRTVAAEHGVSVIENPPLARALHATVEVDQEIPAEHYRAVAEVIGFVMRLRRRAA